MPLIIDAVRLRASVGEISDTLADGVGALPADGVTPAVAARVLDLPFCQAPLGATRRSSVSRSGRRLAFDAAKGRLWVVCRAASGGTSRPLEERWEAIEQAERLFAGTRLRVSTDHVGLARVREGTELVRIGAAQRPELAAWRYGDRLGRRRTRARRLAAVGTVGASAAMAGVAYAGDLLGVAAIAPSVALVLAQHAAYRMVLRRFTGSPRDVVARLTLAGGDDRVRAVTRRDVARTSLVRGADDRPALRLALGGEFRFLTGAEAVRVAARLLPTANGQGADVEEVRAAVRRLETASSPEALLRGAVRGATRWTPAQHARYERSATEADAAFALPALPPSTRLAPRDGAPRGAGAPRAGRRAGRARAGLA
jgi:hypothetical protein